MPRQRGGPSRAPSRPTAAPARPSAPAPQQQRPASTTAHPPQQHAAQPPHAMPQQSQGPGLFGQMASTAAGVAVGSSIGHAIGGLFSGGSAQPAETQQSQLPAQQQQQQMQQSQHGAAACEMDARNFTRCLDENSGNMQICNWYLEQLKNCQQMASRY